MSMTFTQPDPEYVWMVTEARQAIEALARRTVSVGGPTVP